MDDTTLTRKVETQIFRIGGVAKGKIDVNAAGGVVWLRGEAKTPALIKRVEAKAVGQPVLDQARTARDTAKQVLDKTVEAAGELGQSMLEEAQRQADAGAKEAASGVDQTKKEFEQKGGEAEKQIHAIVDKTSEKVQAAIKALEELVKHASETGEQTLKRDDAAVPGSNSSPSTSENV